MKDFPYASLPQLPGFRIPVYASLHVHQQAQVLAQRFEAAYLYLTSRLGIEIELHLALLSQQDWPHYVQSAVYGAALYDYPRRTIVSGAEPTTFWQPIVAQLHTGVPSLLARLQAIYATPDGRIDLTAHVALWMIHDLGHACHLHHTYWFPRKWLMELFATLCLYTYIADQEPDLVAQTATFLLVLHELPGQMVAYPRLAEFEVRYSTLPLANYLWFAGHFMQLASDLHAQFGRNALMRMWQMFVLNKLPDLPDRELQQRMIQADPALAATLLAWPKPYS